MMLDATEPEAACNYQFCGNDPVSITDPLGLKSVELWITFLLNDKGKVKIIFGAIARERETLDSYSWQNRYVFDALKISPDSLEYRQLQVHINTNKPKEWSLLMRDLLKDRGFNIVNTGENVVTVYHEIM